MKKLFSPFFHIYLSVNKSITDCKDIDTRTLLDNFLDKFTACTGTLEMLIKIFQGVWHKAQPFFSRNYITAQFSDVVIITVGSLRNEDSDANDDGKKQ